MVMDIVFEILFELFLELMFLIVPEKNVSRKSRVIAVTLAVLTLTGVIALVIWGLVLIIAKNNSLGVIPLVIGILLALFQIIAGIVLYNRNH